MKIDIIIERLKIIALFTGLVVLANAFLQLGYNSFN